jgi:hypothetical protein
MPDRGSSSAIFIRAYAIEGPDSLIGATLRSLAATDFRMAHMFRVPNNFQVASAHGTLGGCVTIGDFHQHQAAILAPGFVELEDSFARLQGIALAGTDEEPVGVAISPRFPNAPYLVVTTLIETPDGQLIPQTRA